MGGSSSFDAYLDIINDYRSRAYTKGLEYRNPDNPSIKLNYNDKKLLKESGRLGYISVDRNFERRFNNSEYRLNGKHYSTYSINYIHSDLEIYAENANEFYSSYELKEQLKIDENNWKNGKDASKLYKAIISSKYKSVNQIDGLFEFSTKEDTDSNYGRYIYTHNIPIKANLVRLYVKTPTYLEKGRSYGLEIGCEILKTSSNQFIDASDNIYRNLDNSFVKITSSNTSIINVANIIFNRPTIEAVSNGSSILTMSYKDTPFIAWSVGVEDNPIRENRWIKVGNQWSYSKENGQLVTNNWYNINNIWYHFDKNGYMDYDKWIGNYYVKSNGIMAKNEWIGNYYVDQNGVWVPNKVKFVEGWQTNSIGKWYQLSDGTYPKKTWKFINNNWYYFDDRGYMVHDQWQGNYYLKTDGTMAKNEWIGNYYVDQNGVWVPNKIKYVEGWQTNSIGKWYQLADGTYPKKTWKSINNNWYYFDDRGYMVHDQWQGNYYLKTNGTMAKNEWIGNYYVDNTGLWNPDGKQ